jgi:hypothetical protein
MKYDRVDLPVRVENYFFEDFGVEWEPENENDKRSPFPDSVDVSAEIEHVAVEQGRDVWTVVIDANASLSDNEEDDALLFFDASIVGIFSSAVPAEETDIPKIHAMIGASAADTLMGALRERLASATAASPYGPYYLPVIHLLFQPKEIKIKKKTGKKAQAKSKTGAKQAHLKIVKG